jgi:hypothetical protein
MVKSVYVTGFGAPGKTIVVYGLMKLLSNKGYKVGYFKPVSRGLNKIGPNEWVDDDVLAIKEAMGLKEDHKTISPIVIRRRFLELIEDIENILKAIKSSYERLSRDKDIVFVESYLAPYYLYSIGLSGYTITKLLRSDVLFIIKDGEDAQVDEVIFWKKEFEAKDIRTLGVIFNVVPIHLMERVKEFITPFLESRGISSFGMIPDKGEFMAPTLLDISSVLDAEVLEGEDYLDNLVEEILVGAMGAEAALKWLRRSKKPVIITGGDRTELLLTLLEVKPSGLVLTGNLYPALKVLTKAREKKVPILLVPYDTFATVERLRDIHGRITSYSLKKKEKLIMEAIEEGVDIDRFIEAVL